MEQEIVCLECNEICTAVEETFDYAGTHCTHGRPGTHRTGHYVSDCCGGEFEDYNEWLGRQEIPLAAQ